MNKTYKVIYNRTRCMYQVVSELAKGHTKSETPEMLKTVFSKHGSLARGIVMAVLSMSLAMPVGVAVQAEEGSGNTGSGDTTYISDTNTEVQNIQALDKQVVKNAQDIAANKTTTTTNTNNIAANKTAIDKNTANIATNTSNIAANKTAIDKDTANIAANTSNIAANKTAIDKNTASIATNTNNIAANTGAISNEITARTQAIRDLETKLTTGDNSLASKANVDASNIGTKIDTSSETTDEAKKKKQEDNAKLWGEALGIGTIADGNEELLTGGILYTELRPPENGFYIYNGQSTAYNLLALDSAVNALGVEKITDNSGNITYVSNLYKYFKANPETTTNDDGIVTYATDADAQGTNSVAIGPNAKTATYTTAVTSGDTTTTTETAADHAVAIGNGATVNAAGDKGIALGNGAVTGEAEVTAAEGTTTTTTDAKGGESSAAIGDGAKANGDQSVALGANAQVLNPTGTAVSTGSTAIGSGAKVDGGSNSIALGTSAVVNTVSDAMALGNGATINKTATGSIAIGKEAVTGGVDKPITLTNGTTGTLAAAGGEDSIAIGNGAVSEGNEALALGKDAKVTNGATGGDTAAAIVKKGSAAIGDGATVANSATSMALGNGASITEGENTTVIGSGAEATQTKQAFVAGYKASSDSSAESSVAIGDNASTHSARTTAIGYKAEAHNADSIAIGSEAKTDDNGGGIAIGNKTSVAQGGIAIGNATQASNISSLAIGNGAVANVNQSISIGYNAGVNTTEDYKERNGSLVAIGTSAGNNVKGMQNVAIGASAGSAVLSSNNIAIGTNAGYGIKNVTSETDTNPQNGYNISIGAGANYTEGNTNQNIVSSIAIGHATHAVNRAVALGEGASAQGDSGMALGNSATSSGSGSIAIGNTASASAGNIALGAGAVATGTPTGTGKWTNSVAPSYYISVGGKGNASDNTITLRRISNVADGSADQDVVTVKQLQKVSDDLENTIKGIDTTQLKTYSTTEIDNKIAAVNQNIKDSGIKYFSINAASQSTNSNNTGANGDGDADAMAIGPNAKASSVKALAIGNNVSASGTMSIAIGTASNPSTGTTTAETPHPTSSEGTSSVAIGTSAIAQTNNSIAIGTRAATYTANTTGTPVSTVGVQSIAIGFSAETRDDNAISIGTKSKANSVDAIAIGDGAEALNTNAVVIGKVSTAEGSDSVTIGMSNANNGKAVITTGNSNRITNSQGVKDTVQNSGLYGSSNAISSVSSSNTSNAITDVYAVGNSNKLNQMGEKNVLSDVSVLGNKNTIENGTAGAYAQTVKQIAVVGSGNTVKGNTQIDYNTWGTVQRDTILGYKNTVDATTQWTPVSNLQILGNDVKATLGNSVYLGTGSSATASKSATAEAITLAKEQGDAEAIASDEYKKATTEAEQTAIKQKYEAQYIHAANIAAMDQGGISAGITNYDKDYTYGNDSAYTYAGSQATGVVTVGSKDATRRIQNVSAGLVGPNSTDAVNGSQLYALTRQIRFGGDNSTFGDVATSDVNVVAKGSNEKLAITGGAEGVSNTTTTDGKSVTTVDGTKITDKNIAVIAEDDALHVKLASNLKDLNTAQLGKTTATTTKADDGTETTTYSYQETLKLDGTGDNGGTLALKDAKGENGVALRTSGSTTTADVSGNPTTRLLVNDKTVATTDDGLKFGGDTGTDSALKLNSKLTVKGGTTDTNKLTDNNIGVVSDGTGTLTVKLNKDVNLGTDGSLTTGAVTATTVTTGNSQLDNTGLTIAGGPKFTSSGISANNQQIKNVLAGTDDNDAANYSQIKKATTTLTTGKNGNVTVTANTTPTADGHTNYTIAVDNLAVKANGTGNTTVALANGINFKNGTNTTATVGTDGTITIEATHNKLDSTSYTASNPSDSSNKTTLKLKDTDNNETTLNLTDTYTTVSKNTDHTIAFKRNDGSDPVSVSLDDLNGASKEALTTAVAKATTTVIKGNNVDSVDDDTTSADGHHIYTVNVSNLGVKVADGQKTSVALSDGLVFGNGTNTTASVGQNGAITFNVSNDAIKIQAKDAINMSAGSNVKVETASTDGLSKTFTISATHNVLKSATLTPKSNDVSTLTITGNDGDTASVDIKNTHLTVTKDSEAKTVTFTSNDGTTPPTTLSLSDLGAASTADMTAAAAKAATEVKAGSNATLGTLETDQTDQHKIYTVNVDNLGLKQNGTTVGTGTGVSLKNGLNFTDGTNTTASVAENGTVSYSVSNDAIKAQAKDAVVVAASDNVSIDTPTDENNVKTYTVKVNDLKLQANGEDKGTRKLAEGINFADGKNTTATVEDGKVIYGLNDTLTGLTSMTAKDTAGNQTLVSGSGVTITPAAAGAQPISLTTNGLSMGGQQITNVKSGGDTDTNAANISDVKRLVQASASGTTETGFNVKGDDATAKKVKLGKQLNVVGGTNDTSKLSDGNIGVVTTDDGQGNATLTVKLNKDITLDTVKTGNTTLNTNGVSNGKMNLTGTGMTITDTDASKQVSVTTSGVSMGSQRIQHVADATQDTDAATLKQVKNARTKVAAGNNVAGVGSSEDEATHQMTYTVNVDNLSVKANKEGAKSVTLQNGLTFNNGTNTTASVGDNGEVKYDLNSTLTGLTSVTAGNSTLDNSGFTIKEGTTTKVAITGDNVTMGGNIIHNVGDGVADTDAVNKGQLDALQSQVSGGWNLSGNNAEGTAVTAQIGAGKTVTYADGTYTKSVITKDDTTGNVTVKVDVTTGTFGSGTGDNAGMVTSTANGLATTQDVANAINSASINVVADNTSGSKKAVKAGNTVHFANDGNLTLVQGDNTSGEATFTYGLNQEISISKVTTSDTTKGSTVQTAEGITTTDAAGNTYIQNGQGITLTPKTPEDGKTAVTLSNKGLSNGGNVISGVGDGTADTDAVNVSQLRKVQDQVGSGWQIAGNDGTKVADIGAGKKVTFKSNSAYLTTSTAARSGTGESDTGADVTYSLKTKALVSGTNGTVASVSDADDGLATAKNVAEAINQTYWTAASGKSGSGSQTDETANAADKQVSAGDTVRFNAGNNLSLVQKGASFTYGLQTDLTGMNTIRFGGTLNNGNWSGGLLIGKQAGSGANTADGNYITGLSNTKWDRATISENSSMAATEGQLKQAIENITTSGGGTGGFGLQADTGDSIMQDLRKTIQIKGDGEGSQDGNIKTSNEGGVLRIRLNKALNLSEDGSVQVGSSKMSNGAIQLGEDADANKILMDSATGMATVGGVTINGANKTVSGLSNTTWEVAKATQDVSVGGYKGSTKAATESQLAAAISEATTTAAQNEQHIQAGNYEVGKGTTLDGKAIDKNSVAINVISGDGTNPGDVKGQVVINNVAKADELGNVAKLNGTVRNGNGHPTSTVDAINNLDNRVETKVGDNTYSRVKGKEIADGDSATTAIGKLNNRMNDIYTTAGQHSTVSTADANLTLSESKNASGGTDYKLGLNKEKIDLGNVTIQGNEGSITAKSMKADTFTAGNTVVNKDGVKVGDKSALTGDKLTVGGKDYVTSDGINANGKAIGNVGEGKNDTDAVNVKQVNDLAARQGEAITENAAHIGELGRAVNKLGNRLNRVGAGAAALAALHPGTYDPNDKWDFSAGIGHYHDANAVAIGAYYHPNDTTILSIGGSMGGGENMVNAGITWKMGRSVHEQRAAQPVVTHPVQAAPAVQQAAPVRPAPVTTPAPVVTPAPVTTPVPVKAVVPAMPAPAVTTTAITAAPSGDTAALTQILARQTAILEKLAQNQSQAARPTAVAHGDDIFPDVPENHWAYAYVAKLEKAGALKGFKRPAVLKSPMMTRDDFASVLYTAMANGATTNPALNGDDSLNRLAQEFKAELKDVKP